MKRVAVILLGLAVLSASHAAVETVTNPNDSGPGCLRWCIAHARPGDEIRFDPSLDGVTIVVSGELMFDKNLTVTGRGPDKTILSGNDLNRVVNVAKGAGVTISDLTVAHGQGAGQVQSGGSILNRGVLTLRRSVVRDSPNIGIFNAGGTMTIADSVIRNNWTPRVAGGILNQGTMTIADSVIRDNAALDCGGISNVGFNSALTIDNSEITGNTAEYSGGGVCSWERLEIRNSTISGNTAKLHVGGGIWNYRGHLRVDTSTISGNQARRASAIFSEPGNPWVVMEVLNSTITQNITTYPGWGGAGAVRRQIEFRNSIVADQLMGTDCDAGGVLSRGHNLDSDDSCGFDQPSDITDTSPLLGPLQDNGGPTWTHVPLEDSPVIDRGSCNPGTDQRGVTRPLDGNRDSVWLCDIGAVEFVPYEFRVVGADGDVTVWPADGE